MTTDTSEAWPRCRALSVVLALAIALLLPNGARAADFVLALSWQPAFCETVPKAQECRTQNADRFDASNFSLHGLWPQPKGRDYCGVTQQAIADDKARRWRRLPFDRLPADLWQRLTTVMPGTQSGLERHEWVKHGTCADMDAQDYFAAAVTLAEAVNASPVRDLFAENVGREISNASIRAAFDKAFGAEAGDRVRVACRRDGDRRLIYEITIGLSGNLAGDLSGSVSGTAEVGDLIAAADPTEPGCPGGIVDPAGHQ